MNSLNLINYLKKYYNNKIKKILQIIKINIFESRALK